VSVIVEIVLTHFIKFAEGKATRLQ